MQRGQTYPEYPAVGSALVPLRPGVVQQYLGVAADAVDLIPAEALRAHGSGLNKELVDFRTKVQTGNNTMTYWS